MELDNKYIVINRKDLEYLSITDTLNLENILRTINNARMEEGKEDKSYVVVSTAAPFYNEVKGKVLDWLVSLGIK